MSEPVKGPKNWAKKIQSQGLIEQAQAGGVELPPMWDLRSLDDSQASLLDAACRLNANALFKQLAEKGARFGPSAKRGDFSPFNWAIEADSPELTVSLLEDGHSIESRLEPDGLTPLLFACLLNSQSSALALIERGADVHAAASKSGLSGLGLTMRDCDEDAVLFCLSHRVHARHELDDGGEGLIHQLTVYNTPRSPEGLALCVGVVRSFVEAREIESQMDRSEAVKKRPGL